LADYRVREARIEVCNGYTCWRERRFRAERKRSFLGLLHFWGSVDDGGWRRAVSEAQGDIDEDVKMRSALMAPITSTRHTFVPDMREGGNCVCRQCMPKSTAQMDEERLAAQLADK
jgi:hypothetical protein